MQNDAKLGLVAGIGIVLFVAIAFYRTEAGIALPLSANGSAAADQSGKGPRPASTAIERPPVKAKPTAQIKGTEEDIQESDSPPAASH